MAFVGLPFGIKVEVSWTTGSGVAVCIHFVSKDTPAAVSPTDLANAIVDFDDWRKNIRSLQAGTTSIAGIRATDWSAEDGITAFAVPSVTPAGSNATPTLPLNVAVVASHRTGRTGRSRRGRTYLPGIAEGVVSAGDLVGSGYALQVGSAYSALRAALASHGLVHVVASFVENGAPRTSGLGTAVGVTSTDVISASQRRRLWGRGA